MKRLAPTGALLALAAALAAPQAAPDAGPLEAHRWSHRLLVWFYDESGADHARGWQQAVDQRRCEVEARDLVTGAFEAGKSGRLGDETLAAGRATRLRQQLDVPERSFVALLIGKDGDVKASWSGEPALADVLALIDGMPMRRAEARRRGDPCRSAGNASSR